jgi:hypothetical protein
MDFRPLSALLTMQPSSPVSLTCLAAITFILVLVYRSCSINAILSPPRSMPIRAVISLFLVPSPATPSHMFSASVDRIRAGPSAFIPRQMPQSPSEVFITRPREGEPNYSAEKAPLGLEHNLAIRNPPLIWIPFPRLDPPPSSICGRRGSVVTIWPGDLGGDRAVGLKCPPDCPSDLLSGVGEQFTTRFGRRLSWLVWSDSTVEDSDTTRTHHC